MDVTTTLLLVDDEMLVRAGLKMVLDGNQGISVVGEAGDGLAAVQAVEALRPDVVLMDIRMPGMDGIEAAGRISALPQAPAVVMLTAFDTEDFVADALDAGAQGFLLKSAPPAELVDAVHAAARGELHFTPEVLRRVVGLAARTSQPRHEASVLAELSERELQVALGVADGLANAEIAEGLFLSLATVKTYLNRIFDKTGADSRVQLALLVERARLTGNLPAAH
ncbi:MAG: response regulator transcription factor [Luteococcus sp.]|uniref:response regulator transcription factor n=1 Tax=Luteococcus sp. TaxID=1969402 RepID=UPI0026499407|nr:response regulator transcription factor [Luteococcus sp.]MDN5563529.1 response regulator transcription factor [Luteococcus sp.]